MRLNTLISRMERVQSDMLLYAKSACERQSVGKWIVDANRGQLAEGKNSEGVMMNGGVYSPMSVRQRVKKGLPVDHVYLSFEGKMQAGMEVEYTDSGFSVRTTDWKQRLVEESVRTGYWPSSGYMAPEYGSVFGLTTENKGGLSRVIAPIVARDVRRRLTSGK